jgi:serine/threonine-protein kinase
MPPEQVTDFRSAKPAADQYAAAATAYYLLTGGLPFAGASTAEMLRRILAGTLDRVDDRRREVPKGVGDAVHRAMATKPADRFPDVTAFAAALRAAAR